LPSPEAYNANPCAAKAFSTHALELGDMTGEVKNNVFIECGDLTGIYYNVTTVGWYDVSSGTFTVDYNYAGRDATGAYAGKGVTFTNGEVHEVNGGNPLFLSEATQNYRLQIGSPLKDVGTTIATFTIDKDGTTRPKGSAWDIGAYEYTGGVSTISGSGTINLGGSGTVTIGN